jgi:integrase/recombinase XerD
MPDQLRYVEGYARAYLGKKVKHRRLSPKNAKRYLPIIMRMVGILRDAKLRFTPATIGEPEIEYLLEYFAELDTDTQKWMFSILNGFLEYYENKTYKRMMIGWPSETITNADWLSPEEAIRMLEAAVGVERIIIHMELRLWMRRDEVRGLKPENVQELMEELAALEQEELEGIIQVHGKGRGGGKWRTLAWAPDTRAEIEYYQQLREEMIASARHHHEHSWKKGKRRKPTKPFVEPEQWIIYQKGKLVKGYSASGIDAIVERVAKRAGILRKIGNHTLRRTGARLAYFADVAIVEIMAGLGHNSEKYTIRYLGLTVLELGRAQRKIYDYLEVIRAKMKLREGEVLVSTKEVSPSRLRISR